jgi:hypothetical protein
MPRIEKYLYFILVLLALSIIVWPTFYITGDGASHTYNAKVLFDVVLGREREFYEGYFAINRSIDPNWMSHLCLGVFLQFMPPWLADKAFQILYVLTFAYGFRYFISSLNKENTFLSFLFFPFLFSLPFQQGFYNYCFSLGLLFWSVGFYIQFRNRMDNPFLQLSLSVLLLCTTFSHGMPAVYAMFIIALIWFSDYYRFLIPFQFSKLLSEVSRLALIFLPSAFMILLFMAKRGSGTVPHAWSVSKKWIEFLKGWTSQSTRELEMYPAIASGVLILLFVVLSLMHRKRTIQQHTAALGYVFLFMTAFTLFSYLTCPHSIGGAGSIDIRLGFLPPLFLLFFIATKSVGLVWKNGFIAASFIISISFLVIRFPFVMKANAIGKEIMKASEYIEDKSVVMNINMDAWQKLPNGDSLFHKDGSFIHFSDYIGAAKNKHLIMLMNYEAEINYFPVNWAPLMNPRQSVEGLIPGNYPPCGNPLLYETQSGRKVDYVLLQNVRQYATCTSDLMFILENSFDKVYANRFVELYKRKKSN